MIIKTKKDAEQFLKDFKKYATFPPDNNRYHFHFYDGTMHMVDKKKSTTITYTEEGIFTHFSSGTNWEDRTSYEITNPIQFVWEHRKWINKKLKNTETNW